MDQEIRLLAFDLGASSGRAMLGRFDGQTIRLEELHRFSNDPVMLGETLYWDLPRLVHEIKQGLLLAKPHAPISSMAIDTWGVDFGLIDEHGICSTSRFITGTAGQKPSCRMYLLSSVMMNFTVTPASS